MVEYCGAIGAVKSISSKMLFFQSGIKDFYCNQKGTEFSRVVMYQLKKKYGCSVCDITH